MLRSLPLLLIAFGLLFTSAADAAGPRNCRSGETVYKRYDVRVFKVYSRGENTYYACGPHNRKPTFLTVLSDAYGGLGLLGRSGDKVLWDTSTSGEGGGTYATIGWFDKRTLEVREGELTGEAENDVFDVIVAKDGGLGVVVGIEDEPGDTRVGYLARGTKQGTLRGETVLASAGERYVKGSLAFAGTALTWKLETGVQRTVPLAGEALTCTAGTTLVEGDGARVFEVVQRRKDVLAACPAGVTLPRRLASIDVSRQNNWRLSSRKDAGSRIAFAIAGGGIGLLESGQLQFAQPKGVDIVLDIALGATGPLVFAGHVPQPGVGGQWLIARVDGENWVPLATLGPGTLKTGTLAVAERVTWESTGGGPQSTPLSGETTVDCTTGTTLINRDGLRVFEQLSVDAGRLLACAPGAGAPVQLLAGPRTSNWRVFELGRENGRVAVLASAESGTIISRLITFDTADARAGVPNAVYAYSDVKDAALAADGRAAFAVRSSGKWKIVGYGLGGPGELTKERTLAKPSDGVQAGSLAIEGARVIWRNVSGAERSAAL